MCASSISCTENRRHPPKSTTLRNPDGGHYIDPESGALAIACWEKPLLRGKPKEGFPWDHARHLFDADMGRSGEFLEPALHRLPILGTLGVRMIVTGPSPISSDRNPIIDPAKPPPWGANTKQPAKAWLPSICHRLPIRNFQHGCHRFSPIPRGCQCGQTRRWHHLCTALQYPWRDHVRRHHYPPLSLTA